MPEPVFVLKVALAGRKSTWRRIAIRGGQTLDDLHWQIFHAFDRFDEHLYSFYFARPGAKGRARRRDAEEYACPFMAEQDRAVRSAAKTRIDSLGLAPRREFSYLFDFGDEWWHDITVERVDAPAEKGKYPRVLEKRGKSPPQYPDLDEEE